MEKRKGASLLWLAGCALVAWCAMQATDYWIARQEIRSFSYAQLAHDFPTASPRARAMIQAVMTKGYIESREYDLIFTVMVREERQGITFREGDKSGAGDVDKKRLAEMVRAAASK